MINKKKNELKSQNKYFKHLLQSKHLIKFGQFGLKSFCYQQITKDQLLLINKQLKLCFKDKKIKFWNLLYLNQNLTKLSLESRMGKGKGSIYKYAVFIKPGTILIEVDGIQKKKILELKKEIEKKLLFKIGLVQRLVK